MATRTITIPSETVSYKDADQIKLNPSGLSVPQAQGGNYRVTVGETLRASQTGMGRLASSLQGVNQALSMYADIAVGKEEKALEELRRMSNEKKRELISAENEVFRKMGIRPTSILQVKESLGTVETGKFSADWQNHLDNNLIEAQSKNGSKLTSKQIQTAYQNFRANWSKENEFLSQSQLATDGFMADTDRMFDRNAASYASNADTYYDRNVRDFSIVQDLYTTFDTEPKEWAKKWRKLSQSTDATGMRNALKTITRDAKTINTVAGYERAMHILNIAGDSKNGLKLGSQKLSDSMVFHVGKEALREAQRQKTIGMAREEKIAAETKFTLARLEADAIYKEYRQADRGAKTPAEKKKLLDALEQRAVTLGDPIVAGFLLDSMDNLNMNLMSLETAERAAQDRAARDAANDLIAPVKALINKGVAPTEVQAELDKSKITLDQLYQNNEISSSIYTDLGNKLNAFESTSYIEDLRASNILQLVRVTKGEQSTFNEKEFLQRSDVMNAVKRQLGISVGARAVSLETQILTTGSISYSFNPNNVTPRAARLYFNLSNDLREERERISREIYFKGAGESEGEITASMTEAVNLHMEQFTDKRMEQTVEQMVALHHQIQTENTENQARSVGLSVEQFEYKTNKENILKKELALETLQDRDVFRVSTPDKDGKVDVDIRNSFFDLNLAKPFSGIFNGKHLQYVEGYELMFTEGNNLFEDLTDASKERLTARYKEAINLKNAQGRTYRQQLVNRMSGILTATRQTYPMGPTMAVVEPVITAQSPEGVLRLEKELMQSYELGGIDSSSWMNDDYGDDRFSLRGPEGAYEQGLGYRFRENIPFVPIEIIQKLYDGHIDGSLSSRNKGLNAQIESLPDDEKEIVTEALNQFYLPQGRDPYDAIGELFDNHRAIYETIQGHSFGNPEDIFINDTDEDPRAE